METVHLFQLFVIRVRSLSS